jgi:hypothetical protein
VLRPCRWLLQLLNLPLLASLLHRLLHVLLLLLLPILMVLQRLLLWWQGLIGILCLCQAVSMMEACLHV